MNTLILALKDYSATKTLPVFLIWLFHFSAIIGIGLGYSDWFLSKTPLHLLTMATLLLLYSSIRSMSTLFAALGCFFIGLIAEWIGVHTSLLFGEYAYASNLGWKVAGVPLLIGVNWAVLALITSAMARKWFNKPIYAVVFGSLFMILLDIIMELIATKVGFWEFQGGVAPLKNYVDWFWIGLVMQLILYRQDERTDYHLSFHLYLAQFLFFSTILFF